MVALSLNAGYKIVTQVTDDCFDSRLDYVNIILIGGGGIMGIATVLSFKGNIISTRSRTQTVSSTKPEKKKQDRGHSVRNYDCVEYLGCLFQASMANARRLPCKACTRYVERCPEDSSVNAFTSALNGAPASYPQAPEV